MYSSVILGGEMGIAGLDDNPSTRTFELVKQTLLANPGCASLTKYQQGLLSTPEEHETIGDKVSLIEERKRLPIFVNTI